MINLVEADVKHPLHLLKLNQIFHSNDGKMRRLDKIYKRMPSISVFFIYNLGKIIGTVAIDKVKGRTGLAHFVIIPAFQGMGFGRQTLDILKSLHDDLVVINKPNDALLNSLYKGMDYILSDIH